VKKVVLATLLAVVATAAFAADYTFKGGTDRNPLGYKAGETVVFTVTLVDKDAGNAAVTDLQGNEIELRWTLDADRGVLDGSTTTNGTSTVNPLTVEAFPKGPGFVKFAVDVYVNDVKLTKESECFVGSAGVDIDQIPEYPAPTDLESFWEAATNLLYATPFTGTYAPVCTNFTPDGHSGDGVSYFLFELPMPNDTRPATGIIAMPQNAEDRSCGIVVKLNSYGFGRTGVPAASDVLASPGYIYMAVTRHGEYPVSSDDAYYQQQVQSEMAVDWKGITRGFCFRNNDTGDARDTDHYKMLMRGLRALQFVKGSFRQWNGTSIKTMGPSLGGYQALGLAALDKDVTECEARIPWCADLSGNPKFGRITAWRPDWTETLGYVDLKNLARLCTCRVSIIAGLGDYEDCPPSGEVLVYRNLGLPRSLTFVQNSGHHGDHGVEVESFVLQEEGVSSLRKVAALDTRVFGSVRSVAVQDVLPLAYSNDRQWSRGGQPTGTPATLEATSVDGTAALEGRIEPLGLPETLFSGVGEGVCGWTPTGLCYSVSLKVGEEVLEQTFFLFGSVPIRSVSLKAALDTRPFWPRRFLSAGEVLPFAYDTSWWPNASAVSAIAVTPLTNGVVETGTSRESVVAVTNATGSGTGLWSPTHREVYRAEIRPTGGDAWTVDLDLTGATNLVVMGVQQANGDLLFADLADARRKGKKLTLPHAWLSEHGVDRAVARDTARNAANGLPVWESFVLGLNPQSATSILRTDLVQTAGYTFRVEVRGLDEVRQDLVDVVCELWSTTNLGQAFELYEGEQAGKTFPGLPMDDPLRFYKVRAKIYWR